MRKHRHFAAVIGVALVLGLLAQRSATAQSPTHLDRLPSSHSSVVGVRLESVRVHIQSLTGHPASAAWEDPLLALTTAVTPLPPAPSSPPATAPPPATAGGVWAELRQCESGDDYAEDTGNGYFGAYQFSLATWEGLGYSGLPSDAPPAAQDQAAQLLQARSGWGQWPNCSSRLGL
jgi:hypothetical protein